MNPSVDQLASPTTKRLVVAEIVLVFAVFFIQGAVPVPDVNEPYYLGKAIHFRNPDWVRGDFFLQSKDTHKVFYFTFGWLALWLPPVVLAWFGRVLTWGLLAWSWQRLSFAVVPRRWYSVLSAALLVCLIERCHMAGEWIVGGVEAKGFAFVLVFLGLEALALGRWNRAWLLLGAASAFHVLVGGWSVVATGLAWLLLGKDRPTLRSMWPAILGGLLLSLPGLIPSLMLNWEADGETIRQANQIYVYQRLGHHLDPARIPAEFVRRFVLLTVLWLVLCLGTPAQGAPQRLHAFVAGAVGIGLAGAAIRLLTFYDRGLAAGLLRFYWFRLADVAVPIGVALGAGAFVVWNLKSRPAVAKSLLGLAIAVAAVQVGYHMVQRATPVPPPADQVRPYGAWRVACEWAAHSEKIPSGARFMTPRMAHTFKWYAGRSEVANWKEIPQDACAIVQWWDRIEELYLTGRNQPEDESLADLGAERLKELGAKYRADYVITVAQPRLPLEVIYPEEGYPKRKGAFVIYRLPGRPADGPGETD